MPPDADDPGAALEVGRLAFARPWRFVMGVSAIDHLPPAEGLEIAFAGRSNVGKSSLINALTGQGTLARTSNTPGRTQELNFFTADDGIVIVDMPGYGYARAPKSNVDAWTRLVFDFLRGRANLRRVYVLIDARHGVKANDREALDILDKAAVSYQIVLTKCDKEKPAALEKVIAETRAAIAKRPAAHPEIIATSSATGGGIDVLRAEIAELRAQ
ncbi:MAG: YihA family ribosome biogenesis GTP-binding protein [Rhizobiales bacterium]|nr:YihA family ribosome biogenesis GTP-binding protein [Hyphomicrobiales bacterium]